MRTWLKTEGQRVGEDQVREAFRLLGAARSELTIWEFSQFVRENAAELGGIGFLRSIGDAIISATPPAPISIADDG